MLFTSPAITARSPRSFPTKLAIQAITRGRVWGSTSPTSLATHAAFAQSASRIVRHRVSARYCQRPPRLICAHLQTQSPCTSTHMSRSSPHSTHRADNTVSICSSSRFVAHNHDRDFLFLLCICNPDDHLIDLFSELFVLRDALVNLLDDLLQLALVQILIAALNHSSSHPRRLPPCGMHGTSA